VGARRGAARSIRRDPLRTVFFGTPAWALPSLDALLASPIEVSGVVTVPDRPAGRGLTARPPPVKVRAEQAGVEVLQPPRLADDAFADRLRALAPDVATVVAFGRILPAALLGIPPLGYVNVHFSLLPRYRGAAPVQRAIMDGATTTGVSIIVLTEGMDEGPILAEERVAVGPRESAGALGARLARIGANLLVPTLRAYAAGGIAPRPQDHERATYAPKISAEEASIDWARSATEVSDLVRALDPEPGAWTTFRSARIKVLEVAAVGEHLEPGCLRSVGAPLVGTREGAVVLVRVQPAGKRIMSGEEWARGARPQPGERLE
jgi:methionyl-tRNA formyltransferase